MNIYSNFLAVQQFPTQADFPAFGVPNILYIDQTGQTAYYYFNNTYISLGGGGGLVPNDFENSFGNWSFVNPASPNVNNWPLNEAIGNPLKPYGDVQSALDAGSSFIYLFAGFTDVSLINLNINGVTFYIEQDSFIVINGDKTNTCLLNGCSFFGNGNLYFNNCFNLSFDTCSFSINDFTVVNSIDYLGFFSLNNTQIFEVNNFTIIGRLVATFATCTNGYKPSLLNFTFYDNDTTLEFRESFIECPKISIVYDLFTLVTWGRNFQIYADSIKLINCSFSAVETNAIYLTSNILTSNQYLFTFQPLFVPDKFFININTCVVAGFFTRYAGINQLNFEASINVQNCYIEDRFFYNLNTGALAGIIRLYFYNSIFEVNGFYFIDNLAGGIDNFILYCYSLFRSKLDNAGLAPINIVGLNNVDPNYKVLQP